MKNANSSTSVTPRCQFHFSDGRRCRMLRSPAHSSFCAFHARQERQLLESQRLGDEISASLHGDFLTATDINHVLGKLFIAVAQGRVPPRRAAILTYLGQVMLSSLAHVKQEFPFTYNFAHWNKVLAHAAPLSIPPSPPSLLGPPSLPDSNSSTVTDGISPESLPAPPDPASPEED
ncbi:MAG TPA: hypothetical protein VE077_11420 [Candidatus Methylomirabilis sp.]|nr:hypothetical protein [Candidatus Methylomirabilis sp.]